MKRAPLDRLVQGSVEQTVVLFLEFIMRPPVQRQLPALAEGLSTAVNPTDERLLVSVRVLVLLQVLREREDLAAVLAGECFLMTMDVVVSLERELCSEALVALRELTFEDSSVETYLHLSVILRLWQFNLFHLLVRYGLLPLLFFQVFG